MSATIWVKTTNERREHIDKCDVEVEIVPLRRKIYSDSRFRLVAGHGHRVRRPCKPTDRRFGLALEDVANRRALSLSKTIVLRQACFSPEKMR